VEGPFTVVTLALLAAAFLTFMALVREALPHLSSEDRSSLRSPGPPTFSRLRVRDKALGGVWEIHCRVFPKSRKRGLFAALLIAAALSVFGYPLWMALK